MGTEIERKFLPAGEAWRTVTDALPGVVIRQGYLNSAKERAVRVRVMGEQGYLTIKGPTCGASRLEFEYPVSLADAEAMLALAERPLIEKRRWNVPVGDVVWEIDEFFGDNAGLVVLEVELRSEAQPLTLPLWVGREVTADTRYANAALVRCPYSQWETD